MNVRHIQIRYTYICKKKEKKMYTLLHLNTKQLNSKKN